jgi:YidC/Oxa1 family membrane protein insertase
MDLWNTFIHNPMLNVLLVLYQLLFHNLTLTIVVFTILTRLLTYPLTAQSQKAMKKQTQLQQSDAWKKMQEKYGKDREKLAQEQWKMLREAGVNPLGGCLPMLIQFPILIGLYGAITAAMASSPIQLLNLSQHVYSFLPPFLLDVPRLVPLDNQLLWLNLGLPDPFYILPILVVVTTWIQSKVMTPPTATADPQAAQMNQSMAYTMPLMIGWFSLQVPSGLSVYWVVGNIIGIAQYAMTSPVNWKNVLSFRSPAPPAGEKAKAKAKKKS